MDSWLAQHPAPIVNLSVGSSVVFPCTAFGGHAQQNSSTTGLPSWRLPPTPALLTGAAFPGPLVLRVFFMTFLSHVPTAQHSIPTGSAFRPKLGAEGGKKPRASRCTLCCCVSAAFWPGSASHPERHRGCSGLTPCLRGGWLR